MRDVVALLLWGEIVLGSRRLQVFLVYELSHFHCKDRVEFLLSQLLCFLHLGLSWLGLVNTFLFFLFQLFNFLFHFFGLLEGQVIQISLVRGS